MTVSEADVFAGGTHHIWPGEELREGPRRAGHRQLGGRNHPRDISSALFNGVDNITLFDLSAAPSSNSGTQLPITKIKVICTHVTATLHGLESHQPYPELGWATAGCSEPCPVKLTEPSTRLSLHRCKNTLLPHCVGLLHSVKSRDLN